MAQAAAAQSTPEGELRHEVEEILGLDISAASDALSRLLDTPPGVVRAAVALWGFAGAAWADNLPRGVDVGAMPTQADADAWACEHTLGLIPEFPLPDLAMLNYLLAGVIATRISWACPYTLVDAAELRSPWSTLVTQALALHCEPDTGYFADTADAGVVGVHIAFGTDEDDEGPGLEVTSVIAHADIDPAVVLDVAHRISRDAALGVNIPHRPLSEMDLGEGAFWTVTEGETVVDGEHVQVILPAWQADSTYELTDDQRFGFGVVSQSLWPDRDALDIESVSALHGAVAGYGQYGFQAAACFGIALGGFSSSRARLATLRFAHPYAVVAAVRGEADDPWNGVPIFSCWVTEPSEPAAVPNDLGDDRHV
jgi:hypothetical protein